MSIRSRQVFDYFRRRLKSIAKPVYRYPVIRLARFKRGLVSDMTFIGVTGSSGKTTTKDLIRELLLNDFRTAKSDDTNNQLFSAAMALLRLRRDTQILVVEIGASATSDMNSTLKLLQPDIGVLTHIGLEHFKAFRSREAVAAEKAKLARCLPPNGTVVLNADDQYQQEFPGMSSCKVITYGFHQRSDLRALQVAAAWPGRLTLTLLYRGKRYQCRTRFCGEHMAGCILAALAATLAVGLSLESAIERIGRCTPTRARMMPYETASGIQFIRDDWKAPYWSIFKPIEFMKQAAAKRKIILIGTISDMPGSTSKKYRAVAESALVAADIVYFYGPNSHKALQVQLIRAGKMLRAFKNFRELAMHLKSELQAGDLVLLKGSGADHLARIPIMYEKKVSCWRQRCQRENMCDVCPLVSDEEE